MTVVSLPAGDPVLDREWLVCNGLGGYASGTIGGAPTRRYHGYLIAALPNPAGRVMMFNALLEQVRLPDGARADLGTDGPGFAGELRDARHDVRIPLVEFRTELGLPIWRYAGHGEVIERRIVLS
jgi:hypothetical protein